MLRAGYCQKTPGVASHTALAIANNDIGILIFEAAALFKFLRKALQIASEIK
jgi:hypothetical protein